MPSREEQHPRSIRSFVLRAGRLTPAQQKALDELYPLLGIASAGGLLDYRELFGRDANTIIEIGFGNGDATWRMAADEPELNFIAIEVHPPGVGRLLQSLHKEGITNVRIAMTDAVEFIERRVAAATLAGIRIYFPDPWPKKRHHKRRIIQPDFVGVLARKLGAGGVLHLATDWTPYAEHMLKVVSANADFENQSPSGGYCLQPQWRPDTKYEKRGDRLGHETRDLVFVRRGT